MRIERSSRICDSRPRLLSPPQDRRLCEQMSAILHAEKVQPARGSVLPEVCRSNAHARLRRRIAYQVPIRNTMPVFS